MFWKTKPTTVAEAISGLVTAVENLETVSTQCSVRCGEHSLEITRLEGLLETDSAEEVKALAVARKLREITEPKEAE